MNSPWAMHASMGRNPQLTSRLRCLVQLLLRVHGYMCRGYVAVYTETYYWAHSPWNHKGLCHDHDIRSPCTLLSDRVHTFAVRLLYVLPFPFLSICPVSPPIGERVVRSVSLFNYLICFLSRFRLLYVPVPVPLLIRCLSVIRLSHLPYLLSTQRDCARRSSVIPTSRTSPHPFYLV